MSDIKSLQRLLVVQALYELSINQNRDQSSMKEIFDHIIEQSDIKRKLITSRLKFAEKIFKGVTNNIDQIDRILRESTSKKIKVSSMDKLLLAIFKPAIYEIIFSKDLSKKVVISEYLLIASRFFGSKETALINGVLDNLQISQV